MRYMKIFFLLFFVFLFVGCNNSSIYEKLLNNIAEVRQELFVGSNEDGECSLICGIRESEYVLNGKATTSKEFGVLTFKLKNYGDISKAEGYKIKTKNEEYYGDLEQNPYDGSWVADIGKIIKLEDYIVAYVYVEDREIGFSLSSVSENFNISYIDAIKIVSDRYNKELKNFVKKKEFCGEMYVYIIEGDSLSGDYYWQVKVISAYGDSVNVFITASNGDIVSSNINIIGKIKKSSSFMD